jgi:hypothetical protein
MEYLIGSRWDPYNKIVIVHFIGEDTELQCLNEPASKSYASDGTVK